MARATVEERLMRGLVQRPSGCLEWTRNTVKGYGRIWVIDRLVMVHHVAWSLANNQPIPDGLQVLHHCDNPPCCETVPSQEYPEGHLFLGTNADNVADKMAKGRYRGGGGRYESAKTHCPRGHEYTEANTYVQPSAGGRVCRTCKQVSRQKGNVVRRG